LAPHIPSCFRLVEVDVNRTLRELEMQNRATSLIDAGSEYHELPDDWLETVLITLANGQPLTELDPGSLADRKMLMQVGPDDAPRYFAYVETGIQIFPVSSVDRQIEILYYQMVPSLTEGNATNWLSAQHEDVYIYGALMHSGSHDERLPLWKDLYTSALEKMVERGHGQ